MSYHNPVMLHESTDGLNIKPEGRYVDVTFGGGGHSRHILSQLSGNGQLIAFDQDADARQNLIDHPGFLYFPHNYRYIKNFLKLNSLIPVDGILADLGVSSHQFDTAERGFSTRFDGPLDMRMNQNDPVSAADIINSWDETELYRIFKFYGEVKNPGRLVSTIISTRDSVKIETTRQLIETCINCAPKHQENKYFAMVFQALRIEVNHELDSLKEFLLACTQLIAKGGRLSVITYHSLEDRLVKNFMRNGNFEGKAEKDFYGNLLAPFKPINKKPIIPSADEIKENPRARSAKLRLAERNDYEG